MQKRREDLRRQKLKEIRDEYGEEVAKEKESLIDVPLARDFHDSEISKRQVVEVLKLRSREELQADILSQIDPHSNHDE